MMSLQSTPWVHLRWCTSTQVDFVPQLGHSQGPFKRDISVLVRADQISVATSSSSQDGTRRRHLLATDGTRRRHLLAMGAAIAPWGILSNQSFASFAAEKGFLINVDNKDQYSFLYPFGWQEVVIEGQDKVFKDVIEPLESVSVNLIQTNKKDIRDLGPPKEVAEALIKKVLAPPSQKTKLVEAKEHEIDGIPYYTFEFIAQAPNYTRHALSTICITNGKFYTLTTGANERRWGKMKDRLNTIVDSFKIGNV